jgi:hypothetical protein
MTVRLSYQCNRYRTIFPQPLALDLQALFQDLVSYDVPYSDNITL